MKASECLHGEAFFDRQDLGDGSGEGILSLGEGEGEEQDCQERDFHGNIINCMIKNTADEGFAQMRNKMAGKLGIKGSF